MDLSCGGFTQSVASGGLVRCDGETREPLNCDSEVQYQATNVKGGFTVLGVGNAAGSVEQKALRQIDNQTGLYVAEARRLCDEYNKCVLGRDTYATRSENLRRRNAKMPELLDGVKNAPTDDVRRVALAKAYQELVPDDARIDLRLDFSALAQRPNESSLSAIAPGASLPTGSHLAFSLQVSRPAYVYLFEKSATGTLDVLFPDPRIPVPNPIAPGSPLRIPQGTASYKLDDKDIGIETVYMLASLNPVPQLEAAIGKGRDGSVPKTGALARVTAIDPQCPQSRGLSLDEESAPQSGCVRSRGLSLDNSGSSSSTSSLSTATEAADDTIATLFGFEHTP
jgi:hypothetical protein